MKIDKYLLGGLGFLLAFFGASKGYESIVANGLALFVLAMAMEKE